MTNTMAQLNKALDRGGFDSEHRVAILWLIEQAGATWRQLHDEAPGLARPMAELVNASFVSDAGGTLVLSY